MSQAVITKVFTEWKAQQAINNQPVTLDEFIFAYIPGLDTDKPIDNTETMPAADKIVDRLPVSKTGVVNENSVVYSVTLGADVGDYDFNWIGLANKASGTLAMIIHAPTQRKIKNANGQQGNVLVRSMLMEYSGAREATEITTPAETWQIDFTARLAAMDERQRRENIDLYGAAAFFDSGYLVAKTGNQFFVTKGAGYVAGLRAELPSDLNINASAKPTKIWLDVSWTGTLTSEWAVQSKITVVADLADYVLGGVQHYVFAVASIDAAGNITDLRPKGTLNDQAASDALKKHEKSRNHPDATTSEKGFTQLSSATDSASEELAATSKAVKIAMDNANVRLAKGQNGKDIPDKDLFVRNIGAARAFSGGISIGGGGNWTTAEFIVWLENQGAFNHPYWMCKGSWSYSDNRTITDTGCGNIQLAGAVVEVMGDRVAMTIRVTTASTGGGTLSAQFTYINHGDDYSPSWRRDLKRSGDTMLGELKIHGANALRIFDEQLGLIFRRSEESLHLIPTLENQGENGEIGPLRPLSINLRTGEVMIQHKLLASGGAQISSSLGIGVDNVLGENSIVLGDADTGLKQNGDGVLDSYSNGRQVMRVVPDAVQVFGWTGSWIDLRRQPCFTNVTPVDNDGASAIVRQEHHDRHFIIGGLGNNQFGIYMINKSRTANGSDGQAFMNTDADWVCGNRVLPGNYENFDARYQPKDNYATQAWVSQNFVQNIRQSGVAYIDAEKNSGQRLVPAGGVLIGSQVNGEWDNNEGFYYTWIQQNINGNWLTIGRV
ncbi:MULTISPECIES: phage tail-collar fiber domain-containing protein [Citrobacter freundii complex]|uniref:phage tail-collar fiber domain-containing protein n=1 Tax=Citrobacter freundii complex TaxID=1344959 RepID=UPI001FFE0C65|nr:MULTISPECIES: phage tail protein [Citrobacter freundii complex]MDT9769677.1 phage tail protein [Citrobacter freundii]MDV1318249.1 phage tail protein [Citrobacter freundii]MEB0347003.1 phage tail protein [Citrobacter freundii]MEB1043229.1 phage tail protein [Citrobacter freundii]MEB1083759.1 phage tail protein [Citrobacter freundii]